MDPNYVLTLRYVFSSDCGYQWVELRARISLVLYFLDVEQVQVITLTLAITMRVTLVGDFQNPFSPSIYIVSFKTLL